jgi:hypothetical protein
MSIREFNPYEFASDPFAGERLSFCTRIVEMNTILAAKDAEIAALIVLLREAKEGLPSSEYWRSVHTRINSALERNPT